MDEVIKSDAVQFLTGSENVCQRLIDIADELRIDSIVRISCNWTYVMPDLVDRIVRFHYSNNADLTVPGGFPLGLVPKVIKIDPLKKFIDIGEKHQMNRPTYAIKEMPEDFSVMEFIAPKLPQGNSAMEFKIENFREFFKAHKLFDELDMFDGISNYRQFLSVINRVKKRDNS